MVQGKWGSSSCVGELHLEYEVGGTHLVWQLSKFVCKLPQIQPTRNPSLDVFNPFP